MSLFEELKRRNVFRVGAAYLVFAWLLVQLVETILPSFGYGDAAVRNVVIVLAVAFVPVLIIAWAFELTEQGFKRDREVERSGPGASISPRVLNRVLIVLLVVAVSFFTFDKLVLQRDLLDTGADVAEQAVQPAAPVPADARSVAVLPFVAMSSGEDDEYFADGLTEEILNSLASLPELLVTARTSAFHFKGTDLPVPQIAETLGVAHVVEGSVRRSGERVRITAQLIRAQDGFHLWSQTYDRTLEDVFAVQEDIAQNIAEVLDVVLDEAAVARMRNAGIGNVEAFIAYQKGNEAFAQAHTDLEHIVEGLDVANSYYEQVLAVAPRLLEARLRYADLASHQLFELAAGYRAEAWPGEARATLEELAETYSKGWEHARPGPERAVLEVERMLFDDNWRGLASKLDEALAGDACVAGNWIYQLGLPFERAEATARQLLTNLGCDPMSGVPRMTLVQALIWAGDPQAALEVIREAEALGVTIPFGRTMRLVSTLAAGGYDGESATPVPDGYLYGFDDRLLVEASVGDADRARRMAADYIADPGADGFSLMVAAAAVGDRETANANAAAIDARAGGPFLLAIGSEMCFCGAPFDLDATPNFKARLDESGFPWPPRMPIDYPLKTW
jgi:adenylate cyclase